MMRYPVPASLLLFAFCGVDTSAQTGSSLGHPFGQHNTSYVAGTIRPNQATQAQLDATTASFYDAWKARYLKNNCLSTQYYVYVNADGASTGGGRDPNSVSISEGHGYGMMITAMMAGYDPNAQTYFDGLYRYFKAHPSFLTPNLMAWNQITNCVTSADGQFAATDGDMDVAYALLLADKQWGSSGAINYLEEGKNVIRAIMDKEINASTFYTLFGDGTLPSDPTFYYGTRTSDFMLNHFKAFGAATADARWKTVIDKLYNLIGFMQATYSPVAGLLPDFIQDTNTTPRPAVPRYLESDADGAYFYNACRDPWRIATDYLISGDPRALAAVRKMNTWIRSRTSDKPEMIFAGYNLNGTVIPGSEYTSMAFVAPFAVAAMVDASNQKWLNDTWTFIVNRPLSTDDYYGNTLKLLGMIVISGNWWAPLGSDLSISKTHSGDFTAGSNGVYTLTVQNVGSAASSGAITVTDILPGGLSFVSGEGGGWSCSVTGQTVNCVNSGTLAAGQSSRLTLTVKVDAAALGRITNTATLSNASDTNSENNTASDATTVLSRSRRRP